MTRRLRWWTGAILAILLAGGAMWYRTRPVSVAVIHPQRKDVTEMVEFDGTVRPLYVGEIRCPFTYERVKRILVNEGQVVRNGQPVVELDDTKARADIARAIADLHAANSALPGVIARERAELQDQLRRIVIYISMLLEGDRAARAELERARRDEPPAGVCAAETGVEKAASSLANMQNQRRFMDRRLAHIADEWDVRMARGGMKKARVRLAAARKRVEDMVLRSRSTGLVLNRLVKPGQNVARHQPLVDIVDFGSLGVGVRLPRDLHKGGTIKGKSYMELFHPRYARDRSLDRFGVAATAAIPGADALVTMPAFPNKEFRGSVDGGIYTEDGQEIMKISLEGVPTQTRPGMPAKARIITDKFVNALTLPRAAIVDSSTQPAVFVIRDGRVARQPVKIGVPSNSEVVVKAGLGDGETVIEHPIGLSVGQRVRPVPAP